jgi:hypothetical protein
MKGSIIPLPAYTPKGDWNATTNIPALSNSGGGGLKGDTYRVSVLGTTSIDGIATWAVEDWIWHDGSVWRKSSHSGGGGSTIITSNEYYVDKDAGSDVTGDGSLAKPFASMQPLMLKIGQPVDQLDFKTRVTINVRPGAGTNPGGGGEYIGDFDVPHRAITIVAPGCRFVGNVNRWISDAREFNTPSADFRGCLTLMGRDDGRGTHPRLRNGIQISGNLRVRISTGVITSINGDGATVTVSAVSDSPFGCELYPGMYIKIANTTNYNGTKLITARIDANTFQFAEATIGLETSGTYVETDNVGATGTTHDASFHNCYISGTYTVDDGTVNSGAYTTTSQILYMIRTRIFGGLEGRVINLFNLQEVELTPAVIVGVITDLDKCILSSNVTTNTFGYVKGLTDNQFTGIWTVNNAGQTINCDFQTNYQFSKNVTFAGNIPTISLIEEVSDTIERTTRNYYLSPTGSDTNTGLSTGSPWFSVHRAIKEIKSLVYGVEVSVIFMDGAYDYSALEDLIIDKRVIKGTNFVGKIRFKPNSALANRFTVLDSGTFDNNTDTESPIHTCTGKAWTDNQWQGKFLRVTSMNSGSLPSNGDGTNYTYRVFPIIRNTADTLETTFVGTSYAASQNLGAFEIVDFAVTVDFGAKNIYFTDGCYGGMIFNSMKWTTTGYIMIQESATGFNVEPFLQIIGYNSHLKANFLYAKPTAFSASIFEASSSMDTGWTDSFFAWSHYNFQYGRITMHNAMRNTTFLQDSVGYAGPMVYMPGGINLATMVWNTKFINCQMAIETSSSLDLSTRIWLDNVDWVLDLDNANDVHIYASAPSYFVYKNYPHNGIATMDDGATSMIVFYDLGLNFNAVLLSKGAFFAGGASVIKNDSSVAGEHIADGLNNLLISTLARSAFNGLSRISVGEYPPETKQIGDIWIDTNSLVIYTSTKTLDSSQSNIICNSASGFTVNLPTASASYVGKEYNIKNIGAGNITVSANVNIDNALTAIISQWQSILIELIDLGNSSYIWLIR